jgi:hypothetical protein
VVECLETEARLHANRAIRKGEEGFQVSNRSKRGHFRDRKNQLTFPNGLQFTEAQPDG